MRKSLLFAVALGLSTQMGWAQSTYQTALDATLGDNSYTVEGDTYENVYWKYTPTEDCAVKITSNTGASIGVFILKDGELFQLKGVNDNYNYIYPLAKDETVYIQGTGMGLCGFKMEKKEYAGLGTGLTADNPLVIKPGKEQLLGNPKRGYTSYEASDNYATYTSDKDGVLVVTTMTYLSLVKDSNGNLIGCDYGQNGENIYKFPVKAGQPCTLTFTSNNLFVITSEFTQPTQGSLDMPFTLKEGDNTVPEDFGTYYYTYVPTQPGFLAITSDETLPGGTVKVYNSKGNITYKSPAATSAEGSFNVRAEVPYVSGGTYFIEVNKVESTDAAQTFHFSVEGYKAGEKEENPIVISELPSEQTLEQAQGTYYYALTVPANTNKFVQIKALTKVTNTAGTSVMMYPKGNTYMAPSGVDFLRYNVNGGTEQTYIIKWTAQENTPVKFRVTYEDIKAGDEYSNPIKAVAGANTISGDGTKYFSYTATKSGKLTVSGTPDMTISFPMGNDRWSGEYETFVSGVNYYIEATEGQNYIIKVDGATDGNVITITESDFAKGESKTNPIVVEGTSYAIDSQIAGNAWLLYKPAKDGVLTIASDVVYDGNNLLEAGKSTDYYLSQLITTVSDGSDTKSIYQGSIRVAAGDEILVHMQLKGDVTGKSITFTLRDFEAGESFSNPLELVNGQSYSIPSVNNANPIWCKLSMPQAGKWSFENLTGSLYGTIYKSREDAAQNQNGVSFYTDVTYDSDWNATYTLNGTVAAGEEGDYYIKITSAYEPAAFTMSIVPDVPTAIKNVAGQQGVKAVGNGLVLNADADVKVYSLGGQKVAERQTAGTISLQKGVYIVSVNGQTQKIAVK